MTRYEAIASTTETAVQTLTLSWADRDPLPRAIITEDLVLVWDNAAAAGELARRNDIEIRDGHFASTNPAQQAALCAFIRSAGPDMNCWCLPCEGGDGHVVIRVQELNGRDGERVFGIVFHRTGNDFEIRYADLDEAFRLTPAEHRLLLRLIDGRTADEAATDLGVSVETARSHIRQIYTKLGVRSREGMFRRIRPYRI